MSNIVVSIFMLTYNQEKFIAQAIEGVLMQQTSFLYQLVIGEDCSTDTTRQICESYAQQFPEKIKLLSSLNSNIGLIANYMRTIKECNGKYIAICDGDDYWIDKYKLQKQVDFLESNPDYCIVGTNLKKEYPNGNLIFSDKKNIENDSFNFDDLIFRNLIPSVTVVFKNIVIKDPLPNWVLKFPYGDWSTYLWTIRNGGKIYFLNDVTAVYRMGIGVSFEIMKKPCRILNVNLGILESILLDVNFKHKENIILKSIFKLKIDLMMAYNREKSFLKSLKLLWHLVNLEKDKFNILKCYSYSLRKTIKSLLIN